MSATEEDCVPAITTLVVRKELRKGTYWTPSTLRNNFGVLDVNKCIPMNVILDMDAATPMFFKAFVVAIGNDVTIPTIARPFFDSVGGVGETNGGN